MRIKLLTILLILCVFVCGCSDERLSQPMEVMFFGEPNEIPPEGELGPPPPHIQEALWSDQYDKTLSVLLEYEKWKERGQGEVFKPVVDGQFGDLILLTEMRRKYYTKYIDAGGVAILGNAFIKDQYFYAARELVLEMTSKRPELRELLAFTDEERPNLTGASYVPSPKFFMTLYHEHQGPTAIPELFPRPPPAIGWCSGGYCVVPVGLQSVLTEDALNRSEVRIAIANFFIHEFAHAIHFAIRLIDPTIDVRLQEAYEEAVENDSAFSGSYVEHWAVAAQNWFLKFSRNPAGWKYARFQERNPLMHALMEEWFDFKYLGYVDSKLQE